MTDENGSPGHPIAFVILKRPDRTLIILDSIADPSRPAIRNGAVLVWLTRRRDDFNAEQHTRFRKVAARRWLRLTPVIMLGDTLHASREQISAHVAVRLQRSPPTRGLRLRKFSELQIES